MATIYGRILRIVIGFALIAWAMEINEILLYIFGLFFIVVGAFDVCALAPFFKMPFNGKDIRALK
jgi:uncharacterized membrane protein HdeD (DUF308 family)